MSFSSFKNFLVEEEKTAYFTFGRMNPPTIGHEKLLNSLATKASKNPYKIYLSQSEDNKKNPLPYQMKIKSARKMFPKHARMIILNKKIKSVFDCAVSLYDEGFKNIIMVVGSDRVREFDILLNKYNGKKGKHGLYNFQRINIISAGARDPDAEGADGMSATKMRTAAAENDFTSFAQGLPRATGNPEAKKVFNAVRKGMGLKEENEFKKHIQFEPVSEVREKYVGGDLYKVGDSVINKESGEVSEITKLGANYVMIEANGSTYRKWLTGIEHLPERTCNDNNPKISKSTSGNTKAKNEVSKLRFKRMYDEENTQTDLAKKRIDREKNSDANRHDRMMDRARMRDTKITNKAK